MLSFQVSVLGALFVSFRPTRFRSHSRSTGACLFSAFPLLFRFLSSTSVPVLTTQPSVLPFPSSWFCLSGAFPVPQLFLSASPLSAFSSAWFPMLRFRFSVLGALFVSFHPSRFRSHSRSTGASLPLSPSGFPLTSAFFRPLPLGSDYSAFRSFFSLLPVLPCRRFLQCFFPLPSSLLPCFPSDSGTQPSAIPFALAVLPHSGYLSASAFFLSAPGLFPLAFALGSGYSAWECMLFSHFPVRSAPSRPQRTFT